ncbi:MAG: uracil-xanthine permease family protein, partial [Fusobacteriaceae bacterium]
MAVKNSNAKFELDGRPELKEAIPLAMQHIVDMFAGNIAPVLIIARVAKLEPAQITVLLQCALLTAAIATLLQNYPIKIGSFRIGAKLPVVMGISFGYLPALLAITNNNAANIPLIFGAQIVGGVCSIFMGVALKKIRKFFPPIVAGTVVFAIGLSLFPVGINYMAGGAGSATYGSLKNWGVALFVLCVVLGFNQYAKGFFRMAAVFVGIISGYILAIAIGMVNFQPIADAQWFSIPKPFSLGAPRFEISAIITMVIMYLVTAIQAIGDFSAV